MEKKNDNKKKVIIIVIAILLLIAIGVIVALFFMNKDKDKNNTTTTAAVVENVTITFNSNGGEPIENMIVKKGEEVTLPIPSYEGYVFKYWSDTEDVIMNETVTFDKDTTLNATWEKITKETKTMKITFDSKGGSKVSAITLACEDDSVTIKSFPKNPTKKGYTFRAWEDKHGKAILAGAKLTCDDVKLYAAWDQNDDNNKSSELKCDIGTLEGDNCIETVEAKTKCPDGTSVDGNLCVNKNMNNAGNRVCKEDTVAIDGKGHTATGRGDYYMVGNSYGKCAYYKWTNYTTKSQCEAAYDIYHKTTWVSELNACYAETKTGNYETACSSGYKYYSSDELSSKFGIHDGGKCLKIEDKTKYCDNGYTLNGNKCIKVLGKATPKA